MSFIWTFLCELPNLNEFYHLYLYECLQVIHTLVTKFYDCSQNINLTNIQMDFCGKIISDVLSILN